MGLTSDTTPKLVGVFVVGALLVLFLMHRGLAGVTVSVGG